MEKITLSGREYERGEDNILRDSSAAEGAENNTISEEDVDIKDVVDYNTAGVYEVTYEITTENDKTGSIRLIVVVNNRGGNENG